jgi:hypothetical protein
VIGEGKTWTRAERKGASVGRGGRGEGAQADKGQGWRCAAVDGNGEVLVGRDVVPFVGMRVLMSRQYRQFLNNVGQRDPSGGGGGVIIRMLAGSQTVGPSRNTREFNGNGNGMSVKVTWDECGTQTRHATGLGGRFELASFDPGLVLREARVRETTVQGAVGWMRHDATRTMA